MKKIILASLFLGIASCSFAQNFKLSKGKLSFFSETPVENIDAHSESVSSIITPARKVAMSVQVSSFQFKNALMQEHFCEKYIESEKFPTATFTGVIDQDIDLNLKGSYTGSATGKLKMHGIEKEYTVPIKISIPYEGHIDIEAQFMVKIAEHGIQVPELVFEKIAQDIKITFKGGYDLKVEVKAK